MLKKCPVSSTMLVFRDSERRISGRNASRLGYCHHFKQVAVRILEVETASSTACVELPIGVIERRAPVGETLRLHAAEDRLELRFADMKCVMLGPRFWLFVKIKGQAVVDLHLSEVPLRGLDCQTKDFGEELG